MLPTRQLPALPVLGLVLFIAAGAAPISGQNATVSAADSTDEAVKLAQEGLPLMPGRWMEMTATEGSWMSVDVSPDGRTLVFDLLGDLWTLPIGGGQATPLTQGMAFDGQPRFSPDGTRVVFMSDRSGSENLYIISLDKSDTVAVTSGKGSAYQSPEWTPDGDYIVASHNPPSPGPEKLRLYHADGGSGVFLTEDPQPARMTGAAFGDDDRYVWYAQRRGSWQYNSPMRDYQLAVYDRETGRSTSKSNRYGGAVRPTLSPDGRWLVYATRHIDETGLRIRDLTNGDERWLAYPVQRDQQESRAKRDAYPGMSFTPDSRAVVATYGGKLWRIPIDGGEATNIPFTADVKLAMGPEVHFDYPIEDTPTFVAKQIRDAVPSPDGRRLAFVVLGELYTADLPNGSPRRVTELDAVKAQPVWSPDGEWIAFTTWSDADGGHLYKVRRNGQSLVQVSQSSALYTEVKWSPDGERILAFRGPGRAYDDALTRGVPGGREVLVWVPAAGGAETVVSEVVDFAGLHFTNATDRIWATSFADGLISMRWDGTDRKSHVKVRGGTPTGGSQGMNASRILMSPEGDQALAQIASQLFVVTVPMVGGDTPTISVSNPDNAAFPAQRLTDIGAQFPAWSADGGQVHWSIGNAFFTYDLSDARAHADSVEAAEEAAADDTTSADSGDEDADEDSDEGYRPDEVRLRIEVDRDIPTGSVVLRGARVVTMNGDEVIESGDVVVTNNRIAAIGATGTVSAPANAQVIDVSGKTIVPGFVDTHAHLRAQVDLHRRQPWSFAANLAYGVTTTRDPQTGTTDVLSYEDFARAGLMLAPRIYSTGPGVFSSELIGSLKEARTVMRRYSEYYDTKTIKMYGAGNREVRQWIIQAAREEGLMPTTEGSLDLRLNMTMGQDGYSGMEHNMPGFPLFNDVAQLVARSTMAYTPTILVSYGGPWAENYYYATEDVFGDEKLRHFTPFEEIQSKALRRGGPPSPGGSAGWFHPSVHTFDRISAFARDVLRADGLVGVGSHGQLQGLGYHWELWSIQSGGMTEHEALRVATIVGARALGLDNDLGSIEAGKLADLVVLDENPLQNIRNSNTVGMVMINGRLYDGDTLAELWPTAGEAPAFYWLNNVHPEGTPGIR